MIFILIIYIICDKIKENLYFMRCNMQNFVLDLVRRIDEYEVNDELTEREKKILCIVLSNFKESILAGKIVHEGRFLRVKEVFTFEIHNTHLIYVEHMIKSARIHSIDINPDEIEFNRLKNVFEHLGFETRKSNIIHRNTPLQVYITIPAKEEGQ